MSTIEEEINPENPETSPSSAAKYLKIVDKFQELLDECRSTIDNNEALPILPFLNSVQMNISSGRRKLREHEQKHKGLTASLENIAIPSKPLEPRTEDLRSSPPSKRQKKVPNGAINFLHGKEVLVFDENYLPSPVLNQSQDKEKEIKPWSSLTEVCRTMKRSSTFTMDMDDRDPDQEKTKEVNIPDSEERNRRKRMELQDSKDQYKTKNKELREAEDREKVAKERKEQILKMCRQNSKRHAEIRKEMRDYVMSTHELRTLEQEEEQGEKAMIETLKQLDKANLASLDAEVVVERQEEELSRVRVKIEQIETDLDPFYPHKAWRVSEDKKHPELQNISEFQSDAAPIVTDPFPPSCQPHIEQNEEYETPELSFEIQVSKRNSPKRLAVREANLQEMIDEELSVDQAAEVKEFALSTEDSTGSELDFTYVNLLPNQLINLTHLRVKGVYLEELSLTNNVTPSLTDLHLEQLSVNTVLDIVLPKLKRVTFRHFAARVKMLNKMIRTATELEMFDSYKIYTYKHLKLSGNKLKHISLYHADCLSAVSIYAPNLEHLNIEGTSALKEVNILDGHYRLSKKLPADHQPTRFTLNTSSFNVSAEILESLRRTNRCDVHEPSDEWNPEAYSGCLMLW